MTFQYADRNLTCLKVWGPCTCPTALFKVLFERSIYRLCAWLTLSQNRDEIHNLGGRIARVGFFCRHSVKKIVTAVAIHSKAMVVNLQGQLHDRDGTYCGAPTLNWDWSTLCVGFGSSQPPVSNTRETFLLSSLFTEDIFANAQFGHNSLSLSRCLFSLSNQSKQSGKPSVNFILQRNAKSAVSFHAKHS